MAKPDSRVSKRGRPNTLDASDGNLIRILDQINSSQTTASSGSREFSRIGVRLPSTEITIEQPGGNKSTLRLACRNLSRGGIALLHNAFVYTGSACTVLIERIDGTRARIPGRIVRCAHQTGIVHELGIRFDQEIDPRQFVRLDPFSMTTTYEGVDPESLRGVLLYAARSEMDKEVVRHYLRGSNVLVRTVENGSEAVEQAGSGVDVVMTDLDLPDMDAAELRIGLRASGGLTPLIVATG